MLIQATNTPSKNARLADVCIATSAAPIYFPAHHFEIEDSENSEGKPRCFNLIDGGVAANNPVSNFF